MLQQELDRLLRDAKADLALFPPVTAEQQLTAGQGQFFRERFRQQAAVIDCPVPAAGFRHGNPGDDGIRRERDIRRKRKKQLREQPGGTGFRAVFEPEDQRAGYAFMGTERPGGQVRFRICPVPGKEEAVIHQGFPAGVGAACGMPWRCSGSGSSW